MEGLHFLWQVAFSATLVVTLAAYKVILEYVCDKPPGRRSVFDPSLGDFLRVHRSVAATFCAVALASRTERAAAKIREDPVALFAVCFAYDFAILAGGANAFCVCAVRIACLVGLATVEALGEVAVRGLCLSVTFLTAAAVGLLQAVEGDTLTGPGYNLFAVEARPSGESAPLFHASPGNTSGCPLSGPRKFLATTVIFSADIVVFASLLAIHEVKHFQLRKSATPDAQRESLLQMRFLTLFTVAASLGMFFASLWMAKNVHGRSVYPLRLFFIVVIFFVALPVAIIVKNGNIVGHVSRRWSLFVTERRLQIGELTRKLPRWTKKVTPAS
jgi:hypothetical protein